jgi:hypothetical protein
MRNNLIKKDVRSNELNARFILGVKGNRNLVVVGVNPSIATIDNLDPTSKRIKKYCEAHDYDGWILINLYPQISTDVDLIHDEKNDELFKLNLEFIECILKEKDIDLVAAWGESIKTRKYLKECLKEIDLIAKKYNHQWNCFDLTKNGHPCHPLMRRKGFRLYLTETSKIHIDLEKIKATLSE